MSSDEKELLQFIGILGTALVTFAVLAMMGVRSRLINAYVVLWLVTLLLGAILVWVVTATTPP